MTSELLLPGMLPVPVVNPFLLVLDAVLIIAAVVGIMAYLISRMRSHGQKQ